MDECRVLLHHNCIARKETEEMSAPPAWVIDKLRELVRDNLSVPLCVEQICALGYSCTARQVKRWKSRASIRRFRSCEDAELDAAVQRVRLDLPLGH